MCASFMILRDEYTSSKLVLNEDVYVDASCIETCLLLTLELTIRGTWSGHVARLNFFFLNISSFCTYKNFKTCSHQGGEIDRFHQLFSMFTCSKHAFPFSLSRFCITLTTLCKYLLLPVVQQMYTCKII